MYKITESCTFVGRSSSPNSCSNLNQSEQVFQARSNWLLKVSQGWSSHTFSEPSCSSVCPPSGEGGKNKIKNPNLYLIGISCIVTYVAFFPRVVHLLEEACSDLCLSLLLGLPRAILYWTLNKPSSLILSLSMVCSSPLPTLVVFPRLAPVFQCLSCLETPKLDIVRLLMQSQVGQIKGKEHCPGGAGYVVAHLAQDVSDPFTARTHCWLMFNLWSTKNPQSLLPSCFLPGWPSTCAVAWCLSVWSKPGEI